MNYQYETSNESFLKVHKELRGLAVSNNNFMLELQDQSLSGIDPWDENLDYDSCIKIIKECNSNFWYFAREIVRWPYNQNDCQHLTQKETKLDLGNCAMYWCSLNGISTWRTNIRQSCSDLSVRTLFLWYLLFKAEFNGRILSRDLNTAKYQVCAINELRHLLPPVMKKILHEILYNSNFMKNPLIHSSIIIKTPPPTKRDARDVEIGGSTDIQFYHTSEDIKHLDELLLWRLPQLSMDPKRPRINIFNSPFIKDPNPFVLDYIEGMLRWNYRFYDYSPKEVNDVSRKYANGVIYIKHQYDELGYNQQWFEQMSSLIGDPATIQRELIPRRV